MNQNETLRDALLKEAAKDTEYQIGLLDSEAQTLTKEMIVRILNNDNPDVKKETIASLRKLAKSRLMQGRHVLPWDRLEGLELNEKDNIMEFGW